MLDHISNKTTRACLEALVQLHREEDWDAILAFISGLEDATDSPLGDMMMTTLSYVAKMPIQRS